ncbi:alpha/beta hydrolase [Amycolatopsis rhabdoformis]|uniref:Alpha/beta hydrolase n=1 Tax=Amycolatopsis rhabdoformis TaxID=1448059 RepID=A0ABZ1I2V8_9PSEU|nr:alpha/beta hydrolase [Amycolatopsis rhabdoformis]WSE28121.1 alpha/beta hydrolase [Amycolatopsis rhabdoformis]
MGYLEVEDGRRVYFEHHRGSGRAIVLIHGWGATGRCWDTIAPALRANGNEVVLLDQRACGRSDNDFADVTISALGSDVVRLVEHLGLSAPVVNGWSLGGAVAVDAVAKLGANCSGLILTGGATPRYTSTSDWPHGGGVDDVKGVLGAAAADRANTFKSVAEAVCAEPQTPDTLAWLWGMFMEMGPIGDESLLDLAELDQRKILGALSVPVLFLHGRKDGFVPFSGAEAARDLCADARLVEFPGAGHATFLEDRDTYLAEVTGFLNR